MIEFKAQHFETYHIIISFNYSVGIPADVNDLVGNLRQQN